MINEEKDRKPNLYYEMVEEDEKEERESYSAIKVTSLVNQKQQRKAINAVNRAIKNGKIKRPSICHACLRKCKPNAHHSDYNRLFLIQWLCGSCHQKIHKIIKIKYNIFYDCYS